jgi:hypothetical protein
MLAASFRPAKAAVPPTANRATALRSSPNCFEPGVEHAGGDSLSSYVVGRPPDARPLDLGKPWDEDTEGGNQPADKSLINRRLSLHPRSCTATVLLAEGRFAERRSNAPNFVTANIRD